MFHREKIKKIEYGKYSKFFTIYISNRDTYFFGLEDDLYEIYQKYEPMIKSYLAK